jgi:magnesium-transporting ATPase (P-type)
MKIRQIIQTAAASLVLAVALIAPVTVGGSVVQAAAPSSVRDGFNAANPGGGTTTDLNALIKRVVNILLFVVGIASVIMIIIGGLRYVTSGGDQGQISGAKNTIMYAVIGLVVASLAFAIVNFVVTRI